MLFSIYPFIHYLFILFVYPGSPAEIPLQGSPWPMGGRTIVHVFSVATFVHFYIDMGKSFVMLEISGETAFTFIFSLSFPFPLYCGSINRVVAKISHLVGYTKIQKTRHAVNVVIHTYIHCYVQFRATRSSVQVCLCRK